MEHSEAKAKLIHYWELYHDEYKSLIPKYKGLISKKIELGLVKHCSKDGAFIRAYPDIPFLRYSTRERVAYKVNKMSPQQVKALVFEIERHVVRKGSEFDNMKGIVKYHEGDIADQLRPKKFCLVKGLDKK